MLRRLSLSISKSSVRMKWVSAFALAFVSCASDPEPNDGWVDASLVTKPEERTLTQFEVQKKSHKALTGKVTFSGLSAEVLEHFRVIPESGTKTFIPKNQRYDAVDGFWWSGDDQRWFKIPDHAVAWVIGGEEKPPMATIGISPKEGFIIYWNTISGLTFLSGRSPGWFPNSGNTQIGVGNPFLKR